MNSKAVKRLIAVLFGATVLVYAMPFVKLGDYSVSVFDLLRLGSDSWDLMDSLSYFVDVPTSKLIFYMVYGIVLIILPIIEGVLILRENHMEKVCWTGIAGVSVNALLIAIMIIRIGLLLKEIKDSIGMFVFFKIGIAYGTVIVLVIIYAAIVFFSLRIKSMPADIPAQADSHTAGKSVFLNKIDELERAEKKQAPFYGVITGRSGRYLNKAFALRQGESVRFGSGEAKCDIILNNEELKDCQCVIGYDSTYQEYWLQPNVRTSVYLASGQPLGPGRVYYLPRGTVFYIKTNKDVFELR
ncbi:MAG: hypothetical protein ACRC3H_23850 [Lachnospiraceae bacterium]